MKEKSKELKIERDPKTKQIKSFTVPPEMGERDLLAMLFMYLDTLNLTLDKFSKSNNRYSLVLSILTFVLVVFTIIQIVLFFCMLDIAPS